MRRNSPDTRIYEELTSLNAAFLQVLLREGAGHDAAAFGGAQAVVAQLRRLDRDELDFIAGTPALLAEFAAPGGADSAARIADAEALDDAYAPAAASTGPVGQCDLPDATWRGDGREAGAGLFTVALLTWFWKTDRHDQLAAALCIGAGRPLPSLSIPLIEGHAAGASRRLRLRFARHPRFWSDLIRAARCADPDLRTLARLAALPLILAEAARGRHDEP